MITEPRWKSFIVETTTPIFTPKQCKMIIEAGRAEPRNDAQVGNNKGIKGGIEKREACIDVSNLAIYNPQTSKKDKVCYKFLKDGKKVRVYKSTGEVI